MQTISYPGRELDDRARRDEEHRDLVETLRAFVRGVHDIQAVGVSTLNNKRPDLASINRNGIVYIWEVKTRFASYERRLTWEKYATSCNYLMMVYPLHTDLYNWLPQSWVPTHPSAARCGALLLDGCDHNLHWPPVLLTPDPTSLLHLTQSILRLRGSTLPTTSAAASS